MHGRYLFYLSLLLLLLLNSFAEFRSAARQHYKTKMLGSWAEATGCPPFHKLPHSFLERRGSSPLLLWPQQTFFPALLDLGSCHNWLQQTEDMAEQMSRNPCQRLAEESYRCLEKLKNADDRSPCQEHFDNYRKCKKAWLIGLRKGSLPSPAAEEAKTSS